MPNHTGTGHHIQSFRDVALTICHSRPGVYCTLVLGPGRPNPGVCPGRLAETWMRARARLHSDDTRITCAP
jgi:hypothetical protein